MPRLRAKAIEEVEKAVQEVQGQVRTMRDALQTRIGTVLEEKDKILPWIIRHAAATISRF